MKTSWPFVMILAGLGWVFVLTAQGYERGQLVELALREHGCELVMDHALEIGRVVCRPTAPPEVTR